MNLELIEVNFFFTCQIILKIQYLLSSQNGRILCQKTGKCTLVLAQIVARYQRYHLNQKKEDQCIVKNVCQNIVLVADQEDFKLKMF